MGKINLCIAASLDGYIADSAGSVDFLFEKPRIEPDEDYKKFYHDLEIILFGSATYRQITEEISPGKDFYPEKKCYVFSSQQEGVKENVEFINFAPKRFVSEIADKTDGLIWLFGGQKLIRSFMDEDLIDQYWIYIVPVLLGSGVPLFTPSRPRHDLTLTSISKVDDIVKIFYDRIRYKE